MRETEEGPRAARKYRPVLKVEGWGLAGSPSRMFRRWEVRGCVVLEQSEEESFVLKVGLEQGRLEKTDAAKVDQEIDDNKSKTAMLEKSSTLKEGLVELKDNMLMEGVEGSTEVVKDEFNFISKVDDDLAIQNSLDGVRKEKCDWEAELAKFKNINLMKEELKIENENLENLRREVEKTKIGKMSRKSQWTWGQFLKTR